METDYAASKITAVVDKVSEMQLIKTTLVMNKVALVEMFHYL